VPGCGLLGQADLNLNHPEGNVARRMPREVAMKRWIVVGVLTQIACGYGLAQRHTVEGANPNARGYAITNESAQLQWYMSSGTMSRSVSNARGGIVSAEFLKIPEPALREMQKFFKDFDDGKLQDSIKHISKAIKIYPQWAAAHHNLAQTYARMGDYDRAVPEFQSAAELDARLPRPWLGLAKVYFLQQKYEDGETAARRALEIDPVNAEAQYFLARNLVAQGKSTPETEGLLKKSEGQYSVARLLLASVYLRRGSISEAVDELRSYMAQPNAEGKEKVQCMVRKLTEPEGTVECAMR
jgi:tetratricopeptide (TPR) repeat protein